MPTSYPDLNAKDLIRIKSYPVREWGDMIWAYMGPADAVPELPALEMALVPAAHRYVSKKWQDCNWVQALEGSIDTAHLPSRISASTRTKTRCWISKSIS